MSASINYAEAVKTLKENNRMKSEAPETYPHIIDSSIQIKPHDGPDAVQYVVDSGQRREVKEWVYEADYPG